MKVKVYPKGYDPMIADGPPGKFARKIGLSWSHEETRRHQEMESQAVIIDMVNRPLGQWCEQIPGET